MNTVQRSRVSPPEPLRNCPACPVRNVSVCSTLDAASFAELTAIGMELSIPAQTTLFNEGDPVHSVYSVTQGVLRDFRIMPDGQRQLVGFTLPGELVGAPLGPTQPYSADTLGPVVVCRFPRSAFWDYFSKTRRSVQGLYDSAAHDLGLAYDQLSMLGARSAERKVASFLVGFRNRWHRGAKGSLVPLPMTRQDLGDYLGLGISTVSRTLTALARRRVIVIVPGGVRILDHAGLEGLTR